MKQKSYLTWLRNAVFCMGEKRCKYRIGKVREKVKKNSLTIQWLVLSLLKAFVQSLVEVLRSCKPCGTAKN